MHILGGLGTLFRGSKRVTKKNIHFLVPPFAPSLPKKVPNMQRVRIKKKALLGPCFQDSPQMPPDPLKSMENDIPDMLFRIWRPFFGNVGEKGGIIK